MPVQRPPRPLPVLARALAAAGIMLAAASCSHITPIGPGANMPQPHHLRSPLILQDMRTQGLAGRVGRPGGCPAGWVTLSGGAGACYRKTGTPVTITSAAVSPVVSFRPPPPPGQQAPPVQYGFSITVPAADVPALAAVLPMAPGPPGPSQGPPTASAVTSATPIPTISVAGRTWVLLGYASPSAGGEFDVTLPSRNQALQLHRILAASG